MNTHVLVGSALLVLAVASESLALKEFIRVTPANEGSHGFVVECTKRADGALQFTITRDLAKARSFPPNSDLTVRRRSTLKVSSDTGLVLECQIHASDKKESVVYSFAIGQSQIAHSDLTFAEIEDYKDQERPRYFGGGTIYEFHLADFQSQ